MTEGCAARVAREARKVQAKKSIVSLEARVGPVPTLIISLIVMITMVVMTMVNLMMTMNMMGMAVSTFLRIAAPRLCTVL